MKFLLLLALLGAGRPVHAGAPAAKPYNIVLIAVDGLRADHLGCYGYARATSPAIDAIARKSVRFETAESQESWTLPSFASMFTSQYPQRHGAFHMGRRLTGQEPILAELLRQRGYQTAGFVGGPFLEPNYGFSRGFDVYRSGGSRSFKDTTPQALDWIERHRKDKFFAFIHGNDVHPPFDLPSAGATVEHVFDKEYKGPVDSMQLDYYFVRVFNKIALSPAEPPPDQDYVRKVDEIRANPRDVSHIVAHHDRQINFVDGFVGQIWSKLEQLGLLQNTIVVLTADHGLEMDERGKLCTGYHTTLWETITHVPLIVWHPDWKPATVPGLVQLIDIAPSLLELTGAPVPPQFQGSSFAAKDGPSAKRQYAFSASSLVDPAERIPQFSIRDARWKLIYDEAGGKSQLFDLAHDPAEKEDLLKKNADVALELTQNLLRHLRTTAAPSDPAQGAAQPSPEMLKKLRDVGYW